MATIELSSDFFQGGGNGSCYRVFYPTASDNDAAASESSSTLCGGALTSGYAMTTWHLMKGAIPTDFSITTFSTRSADVLVSWQNVYGTGGNGLQVTHTGSTATVNPIVLTSIYVAAAQSGTASWFWWLSRPGSGNNTPGNTITHQLYGTVGTTGSGADMELPSTTIVSGQNYRFVNLRLALAGTVFTF
jgi:hypothetical protein